jgi:hypothetical protein
MSGWSISIRYIIGSPKIWVIRSDSIVASSAAGSNARISTNVPPM